MKTALVTGGTRGIGRQIVLDLEHRGYSVCFNSSTIDIPENIEPLDVLVLNAGITDKTEFGSITRSKWDNVIETNLTEPFFLAQDLDIKDNGRVVFISSVMGEIPHGVSISYPVSKAAVNSLVKNLVKYFAHKKITVNAVAPGFIDTDWHKDKDVKLIAKIESKIALGRFGNVSEVSSLVMEIINNEYINGQIITLSLIHI